MNHQWHIENTFYNLYQRCSSIEVCCIYTYSIVQQSGNLFWITDGCSLPCISQLHRNMKETINAMPVTRSGCLKFYHSNQNLHWFHQINLTHPNSSIISFHNHGCFSLPQQLRNFIVSVYQKVYEKHLGIWNVHQFSYLWRTASLRLEFPK